MPLSSDLRAFYSHPAKMTAPAQHAPLFEGLPSDLPQLCEAVQGLLLHEHWAPAYKVALTPERRSESQIRSTSHILGQILAHDRRALTAPRGLDKRTIGVCRHFTVVAVAMLRAKGIPARARCGFGAYFNKGKFEDHWVVEYWHDAEDRWALADAQIDALQAQILRPDFPLLDVPRDRFIIAGDAWLKCRNEEADADDFGIFDMRGLWFIAGNVLRDLAALNNMEMLPWDSWGAMTGPDKEMGPEVLALIDRVAELTLEPDVHFAELRALYENDERLRVPTMVFNSLTRRLETV